MAWGCLKHITKNKKEFSCAYLLIQSMESGDHSVLKYVCNARKLLILSGVGW